MPASVAALRAPVRLRAFELLAAQPITLAGLSQAERDTVVITAVADDHGNEHPVSRFGDPIWNMAPEVEVKNRRPAELAFAWPKDVPKALVDDAKAALYCALRRGRQGRPWSAMVVAETGRNTARTLRHLASLGLRDFSQVRPLHLSDHIAELRRRMQPDSVRKRLQVIDLVWAFPMEVINPLSVHPWAGQNLRRACGCNDDEGGPSGRTGKTPVIPRSAQRALFAHCEARVGEAAELLRRRDAGEITGFSHDLTAVRDAVLYLVQITSGMRNSESTGITSGCWRIEIKNGAQLPLGAYPRNQDEKRRGGLPRSSRSAGGTSNFAALRRATAGASCRRSAVAGRGNDGKAQSWMGC